MKQVLSTKSDKEHYDLQWSPDGRWIASTDSDDFLVDVVSSSGGRVRDVESVAWSPNGSRVGFSKRYGGLYVGPSDWSKARRVTRGSGSDPFGWTNDGVRFMFGSDRENCCAKSIGVARGDGTAARKLWTVPVKEGHDSSVDGALWSPTGRAIAVSAIVNNGVASEGGGEFLYLLDPPRPGARRVKYTPTDAGFDEWSPDGKWLMVSNDNAVFKLSPKGGRARSVCAGPCSDAVYSPDGASFAFDRVDANDFPTLWVQHLDGSGLRRVADGAAAETVIWSPDGRAFGFTAPDADGLHMNSDVFDLSSGDVKVVSSGGIRDRLLGVSQGGALVAFYRDAPASLWVVDTNGGQPRKVMTLATGNLGSCPHVLWSPTATVLAISNQKCQPS